MVFDIEMDVPIIGGIWYLEALGSKHVLVDEIFARLS
jgi:hypothetical protein